MVNKQIIRSGVKILAVASAMLLLSGCSTTLRQPQTGATVTCQSGAWVGVGLIGLAMMAAGNVAESIAYHHCVSQAEQAGYIQDVPPIPTEIRSTEHAEAVNP